MTGDPFGQPSGWSGASARRSSVSEEDPHPFVNGNSRYSYFHPLTGQKLQATRVSTFAKAAEDLIGLNRWELRLVAWGMAQREDLCELAASVASDDFGTLTKVVDSAREAAKMGAGANRGTAFHNWAEAVDLGYEPARVPARRVNDVRGYVRAMEAHQLQVVKELTEVVVFVPGWGELLGRIDRVVRCADGKLRIADVKTANKIENAWGSYLIQLAVYDSASHWWDRAGMCWRPMPELAHDFAIVTHALLDEGETDVYGLELDAGRRGADVAEAVRAWRASTRGGKQYVHRLIPEDWWALRLKNAGSREGLSAIWAEATAAGVWDDQLQAIGLTRLAEIQSGPGLRELTASC